MVRTHLFMDTDVLRRDFFRSKEAMALKERQMLLSITSQLADDSPILYGLTFHAAFAKRIFDIMKREGPQTLGFERMQQSFTESVEKIRAMLVSFESEYHFATSELTSSTPEARAKLSRLIEDLALMKNWLVSHQTV
jgi:hypothetical protein